MVVVELTPEAERDLSKAIDHLLQSDVMAALEFQQSVLQALETFAASPIDGAVAVLPSGQRVRRHFHYPLWIYYQREPTGVFRVLRLYHYAREPL